MLEFQNIDLTVDTAKLKSKTEAYAVEVISQRIADLFLARYGEQILADIDHDELIENVKKHVTTTLTKESEAALRRD